MSMPVNADGSIFEAGPADFAWRSMQYVRAHMEAAAKEKDELFREFHLDQARTHIKGYNQWAQLHNKRVRTSR